MLFAGIVFFGSILNTSLVSLAERQREVATLRVLGYGPWQVGSLLLRESMITTVLGTLLGMPLGYLSDGGDRPSLRQRHVPPARHHLARHVDADDGAGGGFWIDHASVRSTGDSTMDWLDALKTQE